VRPISTKMKGRLSMAQDAAFFAQLSHDANQVAAELIDTDEMLKEATDLKMRLAVWISKAEGNQEIDQSEIEGAKREHLEYQKSVDASLDRFDALWQKLPRLEQFASSIDGYRIDQFPVIASIRNEAGRNQSHPISHLALELNRIADMAHRESERLWGPADSVKQLTYAATHCRNMARNFLPNLKRKVEFIEDIAAEPELYKRPDEATQEAKRVSEWMQQYCDSTLVDAIRRFNQALQCKPDPLKFIQDATLNWHGRVLVIDQQPHQTACEAARFWCETIRRKVYDLSIRELHKKRDYLKFLKLLVETLDGLAVADMSSEIDREEQATLKALEPKEPARTQQSTTGESTGPAPDSEQKKLFAFRKSGEMYEVVWNDVSGYFGALVGMGYIHRLLQAAGNPIEPSQLLADANLVPETAPKVDHRSLQQRTDRTGMQSIERERQRLIEEVQEAKDRQDVRGQEKAQEELDNLNKAAMEAYRRGSLNRPSRKNETAVRNAINRAIGKIEKAGKNKPELGQAAKFLDGAIKVSDGCFVYSHIPGMIDWKL